MRKFLITVLLAGAAASPALAQDHGRHHGDDNNNQQQSQGNHNRGDRGDANEARQQVRESVRSIANGGHADRGDMQAAMRDYQMRQQAQGGAVYSQQVQQQRTYQRNRGSSWNGAANPAQRIVEQQIRQDYRSRDRDNNWNRQNGGYYGSGTHNYSGGHSRWANGGWDRNWRNNSHYDWRRYRNSHRSIFHLGFYYDPFGYGYSPFSIGYRLQPAYYGQNFWFDPGMYGLPYPPPGTQWVRYWNDAVLVDVYTGEVVDVIRDFFW